MEMALPGVPFIGRGRGRSSVEDKLVARGTAERNRGFGAPGWKERAVSEAEEIKGLNARAIGGDAAGFGRVWKVFESAAMAAACAKKESGEEEEGKKEDDAGASDFERTAQMQRISADRFRSDGGDQLKRYARE